MSNMIHPTVIMEGDIQIGNNNQIGPYTVIYGPTIIGDDNLIGPHVTIGTPGQDTRQPRYDCSKSLVRIGSSSIIREFTAIQKPCYEDITEIGDRVYIMQSVHVPHDAIIGDDVVITPMVSMAGLVRILRGANVALGCSVHQEVVVGHYSIVGMGATITKNIKPFSRYIPSKPISVNHYALKKFGFEDLVSEVEGYVLMNIDPTTRNLKNIVEEFTKLSAKSGRETY